MSIISAVKKIDWNNDYNHKTAEVLFADAIEYIKRVEAHIFKGNEIRADMFMDFAEKQDEISRLDRKRTDAHNRLLTSFYPFLDILKDQSDFNRDDYRLDNRTQIADFVSLIIFEMMNIEPSSRIEGDIRDELAEKVHRNEITYEQIRTELGKIISE